MTVKKCTMGVIVFLVTLMGCQESSSPISEPEPTPEPLMSEFSAHLLTPEAFTGEKLPEADRQFIAEHSVGEHIKMSVLIHESATWDEAHEAMQAFLAEPSDLPNYIREQRAGVFMLKAARSVANLTDAQREGMMVYVDLLAEHRSPEAALVLEALNRLKGFLPEENVRYTAARVVEGADTYLDNKYYCETCPGNKSEELTPEAVVETQNIFIQELLGSVESLRLLAETPQG